jgi:cation transport ATPase
LKLEEAQQTIQMFSSKNLMQQSEMQKMQSALMSAQKEIELLKNRASSVNAIELKNQKLLKEANQAKVLGDNALQEAQQERARAERSNENARKEREAAQEEAKNRREAEKKTKEAENSARDTKDTFKNLFIGNAIFTAALAFFQFYDQRSVLAECGKWFAAGGKSIGAFFRWWGWLYMSIAHGMESWKWYAPVCFILSTLICIFIAVVLLLLFLRLLIKLGDVLHSIACEYDNGLFKAAISVDIALILFFICLWFYPPIKAVFHLNIFSSWLIFAAVGVLIWNAPEIVRGLKNG